MNTSIVKSQGTITAFLQVRQVLRDILVELEKGESLRLKVVNIGIPHNLPTADQGDQKLYIIMDAVLP